MSPVVTHLLTAGAGAGTVMVSLLGTLVSEVFLKRVLYIALKHVAARTKSDADDQLVQAAGEAWGLVVVTPKTEESKI